MGTKYFFAGLFALVFVIGCTEESTDKTKGDSLADTTKPKTGLTVSNQSQEGPHQVKDTCYNCEHVERYDNGVIYIRGDVQAGLRHGTWLTFFRNGKPWSQGNYIDGYREGYGVAWYENGQKSQEGYYKKDKMVGTWKFWNEQGMLVVKNYGGDTTRILK